MVKLILESSLEEELVEFLQASRYQRTELRKGHRNGHYEKSLYTRFGVIKEMRVPRARESYPSKVLLRYQRRQDEVNQMIRGMFLAGVSTRRVGEVLVKIKGEKISAQTVSRIARSLDVEVQLFHSRPLADVYQYLFFDGISLKVKGAAKVHKRQVLCAYGITLTGKKEFISFRQGADESEAKWEAFLRDLYERGVKGKNCQLVITDGCPGLHKALETVYPYIARQRCWVHKLRNVSNKLRRKVGLDYPLCIRLSGTDYEEEEPITIQETKEVAKALEKASVNAIHVSGGDRHTTDKQLTSMYRPLAYNVWAAEEIKKVVDIPVIASGAITSPDLAERILEESKGDFISLGRPLIADPYFPLKAEEARPEDITPCIRCLDGCIERGVAVGSVRCTVNLAVTREDELRITLAAKPKKVAVVGGGPAGMEAARVAALRGHEVILFEKRKLGSMLIEASVPDFKADIRGLIDYLSTQIKKTSVKVVESEATSQTIRDGNFDTVIVATGATPLVPDVPGVDRPSVVGVLDVLAGAQMGKNVIVVGGGLAGCDVALFLAEQGKKVTIVEMLDEIAQDLGITPKIAFFERLYKQDVEIRTGMRLEEIIGGGIIVSNRFRVRDKIECDSIIIATGFKPNRKLFEELVQLPGLEVCAVGDCIQPRKIFDAIQEGYWAASSQRLS